MSGLLPTLKVKKVGQTTGSLDLIVLLKRTWVGRLYVNHLKHIPLVRWLTIRLWRTLYSIYINIFLVFLGSHSAKRWRPLVKLGDYVKKLHLPTTKVFDAARVNTPPPKVFPVKDQAYLVSPHDHYVFPPVYVAELGEALIYGGTNLVFAQNAVICHDLYDFERDYTSEELQGRHVIDAKKMRMRLLRHDATREKIAVAATFLDACAPNYAHWMTEVLPRIATFCTLEQFANVPIIVNDGLHRNIMESLMPIVGSEREIITLPVGRAIQVDLLYVTSVAGYAPFEKRYANLKNHSHGRFCPPALQVIRDRIYSLTDGLSPKEWPSKVYLRRNSAARKITNEVEIERIFHKNGYFIISPENLNFLEQVAIFRNATDVVGSSGAALANLIFSQPTTGVSIFIARLEGTSYWYWQNLASSVTNRISYILGKSIEKNDLHANFDIKIDDVINYLRLSIDFN